MGQARRSSIWRLILALGTLSAAAIAPPSAFAEPGTDTYGIGGSDIEYGSLAPIVTESGPITLSIDGSGSNGGAYQFRGGAAQTLRVQKPAGATVRRAFVAAASTGFSGRKLATGDVKLDGEGFAWDISTTSSISSWNHWAEVTSLVKPKIDAAAPGLLSFSVSEVGPTGIEGEILAVIFDDPSQTTTKTVILLFGAQNVAGDTFRIALGSPIDKADPNLAIDLSLGISFSYQSNTTTSQRSIVNVNGSRLTSIAGGQDDELYRLPERQRHLHADLRQQPGREYLHVHHDRHRRPADHGHDHGPRARAAARQGAGSPWDDNDPDDIETDGDLTNLFAVGRLITNQVKVYSCDCTDVTATITNTATVRLTVKYRDDADPSVSVSIAPPHTGIGGPDGELVRNGPYFEHDQATDSATYPLGTWASHYFQNVISVSWNSAPNVVVGLEDVRLETP